MFGPNTLSLTALLALILALGPVSTDMYVVILSLLPDALDTTIELAQLTMTVFLVSWAIAQLFAGALADRFGRKPVMLGGLGFFILASIACAFATSIEALIVFRFVQALGACTAAVLPRAIVRDLHGREQAARVLGYMGSFLGFVLIFGPILSSYLTVWYGWPANFWLMVVFCAVTIVLVVPLYRESLPTRDLTALDLTLMWRSFARLLSHRAFLGYALTYAFLNGAMFTYFTVSSFLIIDLLDVPAEEFGYYFGGTMIGYVIGSYLTGRFGPRMGIDAVLKASVALAAIAAIAGFVLAWAGVSHIAAVVLPMFTVMFAFGCYQPLCFASALAPFPELAARASALLGFGQMMFGASGSFVAGLLHDGTAIPSMAIIAFGGVGAFTVFRLLVWQRAIPADRTGSA